MIFCLVHTSSLLIFKDFFFLLSVFLYSLFVVLKANNESNVQYISKNWNFALSMDLSFLCFVFFLFLFLGVTESFTREFGKSIMASQRKR